MFHREIGVNNIKNNKQFKEFLSNHELYNIAINRMIPIDKKINEYKEWILREGTESLLQKEFDKNLDNILKIAGKQINKAGEEYKRKLGKCF